MDEGIFVAIIVPVSMFAMIFGIVYLYKKENLAMIERGMDPRLNKTIPNPNYMLRLGLIVIGAGLGLFIATLIDGLVRMENIEGIYTSLIAILGGAGAILSYMIEKKEETKRLEN